MDLSALGITKDELTAQIIERAAEKLLDDMNNDHEYGIDVEKIVRQRVDAEVAKVTDRIGGETITPRVASIIENLTFQKTNGYGEPKAPAQTWREMLIERAEGWLQEPVNYNGKTKAEDSYNFSGRTTRIAFLVDKHLQYEIDKAMKAALGQANSAICKAIADAVRLSLGEVVQKLRIETKVS